MTVRAPLLAKTYEDRRFIVVAPSAATRVGLSDRLKKVNPVAAGGWAGVYALSAGIGVVVGGGPVALLALTPAVAYASGVVVAAAKWTATKVKEAKEAGIHIEVVSWADLHGLQFPPGHPQRKVVYAGHPFVKRQYIPVALFNRTLFQQKVIEAMELLAALGATSIEVQQVAGSSKSASIAASLGVPFETVGGKVKRKRATATDVLVSATLSPQEDPYVPTGLVWYPREEFWKSMAKLRLEGGLETYNLMVNSADSYGVNAGVSSAIQGLGFDIGGDYESFESTSWLMKGSFAPLTSMSASRRR